MSNAGSQAIDQKATAKERLAGLCLTVLLLFSFACLAFVSLIVFRNYPYSPDEYNYLYQARIFASGHTYLEVGKSFRPLTELFVMFNDGKLFSKYPPGCSALLALGVIAGVPGLVNPLLGCLCLWLIYQISASFVGRKLAVLTTLLFASNSYFIGYSGSYFSQTPSLFFCTLALYGYRRYWLSDRLLWAALTGVSLMFAIFVRPLDALCFLIVLIPGVFLVSRKSRTYLAPLVCVAAVLSGVLLLRLYNASLTGEMSFAAYPVWNTDLVIDYGGHGFWTRLSRSWAWYLHNFEIITWPNLCYEFLPKLGIPLSVLAVISFLSKRRTALLPFLLIPLAFFTLYNFHPVYGWPVYGTRYWYPALGCIAVLVAHGLRYLHANLNRRSLYAVLAVFVGFNLFNTINDLREYYRQYSPIHSRIDALEASCGPHSIVILSVSRAWCAGQPRFYTWVALKRNPLLSRAPLEKIYVYNKQEAAAAKRLFPSYNICEFEL